MLKQIFFSLLVVVSLSSYSQTHRPVKSKNGMVVSSSDLATKIGTKILQKGGNAIDAAVAVGFALAVTYPEAGNLGGGGFMVIHFSNGENTTIDFREIAPFLAHQNMYLDSLGNYIPELSTTGWSSSAVPGSVAGMLYALEKYGTLSLEEVISPAIALAESGFELKWEMVDDINIFYNDFLQIESSKKVFTNNGNPFTEGDLFVQKDLYKTLKQILEKGKNGFYDGWVADSIVSQSIKNGGLIRKDDLKNYQPIERKPIYGNYKGFEIISMPPPSSGGIALIQALNILENFPISEFGWHSSKHIYTQTEVLKYVYADRSKHLGDPEFFPVPIDSLISKYYAKTIAQKIGENATKSTEIFPSDFNISENEQTTHYSVTDIFGNAVSVTTTINAAFGNKIVVEGCGFLMNNEMDDFSAKPGEPNQFGLIGSEANSIQPKKRMLSSMTPTIILKNGELFMVIGSPGGSTIITSVLQVIQNVIDFEMNIADAIAAPRFHHQWLPDRIDFEKFSILEDQKENLSKRNVILGNERSLGRTEGILFDISTKTFWGSTDPRGYGLASGY